MPAAAFKLESAPGILATCLEQSQKTTSNHRKNINITYKLFEQCASVVERSSSTGKIKRLTGEIAFITTLKENGINRLLTLKRGITEADRVIKFICAFIAHATEQQQARQEAAEKEGETSDAARLDNAASRLTSNILKHLLKGFTAKDKNVRFRSVQFVALLINGLGELDDTDYQALLENLLERVKDKEPSIRVQAVSALAKLQNPEELNDGSLEYGVDLDVDADDEEEQDTPTKVLLRMMQYDPAAEVRRAAMLFLDLHPTTLPYIISRTRDADPINRRAIYAQALNELPSMAVLSPEQRNVITKNGLRDREDSVKKAAAKLIGKWAGNMEGGLLEFTGLFDVLNNTKIAEDAINSVIETRQDLAMALQFPETFWTDLSPESVLLGKLYITYCKSINDEARLEECLPVITALAFRIQEIHALLRGLDEQMQAITAEAQQAGEEPVYERTLIDDFETTRFITKQLLEIALMADYGDEIGRRKMFTLIRDMISDPRLPAELVPTSMDVLLKLSSGERDFMRVIVEVVQNVREDAAGPGRADSALPSEQDEDEDEDEDEDDDGLDLETATPEDIAEAHRKKLEKAAKKLQNQQLDPEKKDTYLRCLDLVRALLERVAGSLQDNQTIVGLVHELIVPSVKSKMPEVREQGLICLGLCTLLDKEMAIDSFGLFVHQSQATEGELQAKIYQIVFDILMLYGISFLEVKGRESAVVVEFLLHALNHDSQEVQAIAAVGIAKLMLSGMLPDAEVLKSLVLVYFAPETVDNLELRQCLSYFFPVYCYSLAANQKKMQEIFIPAFEILAGVYEELDDPSMMVTPTQLANQLLDWTDPRRAVSIEGLVIDHTIQAELAQDILKKIYRERKKEPRKLFCQLLNKLYLPQDLDEWTIKKIMVLIEQLDMHRPVKDTVAKNALIKFTQSLAKTYEQAAQPMTEEDFRAFDQLHGVVDFLDEIKQEDEEQGDETQSHAGDDSVATNGTATGGRRGGRRGSAAPRGSSAKKTPARRSRSISETPSVEDDDEDGTPRPAPGSERRSARQPKPTARPPQPVIEEEDEEEDSSEEEEQDEDEDSAESEEETPAPPPAEKTKSKAKSSSSSKAKPVRKPVVEESDEATDDTL